MQKKEQAMNTEERYHAILERLAAMGLKVDEPIYTLTWQSVAQVAAEQPGLDLLASPAAILGQALEAVREGLEYLDWYENMLASLRQAMQDVQEPQQASEPPEDAWLEAAYEDRTCLFEMD